MDYAEFRRWPTEDLITKADYLIGVYSLANVSLQNLSINEETGKICTAFSDAVQFGAWLEQFDCAEGVVDELLYRDSNSSGLNEYLLNVCSVLEEELQRFIDILQAGSHFNLFKIKGFEFSLSNVPLVKIK